LPKLIVTKDPTCSCCHCQRRSKLGACGGVKFPRVTGEDLVSVPCSAWELGGGRRSSLAPVFTCPEPIALAIHLQNVHVVRETVEQRSRQALRAKHARPLVKRQIARHDHWAASVAGAANLKKKRPPA